MAKAKVKRLPVVAPSVFYDPERDGITQGILNAYKACRELARNSLQGWTGRHPSFALVFGGMAHYVLNQAYSRVLDQQNRAVPSTLHVQQWLEQARRIWLDENPVRNEIATTIFEEALMKSGAILPQYFKYWREDFAVREWMELERAFRIPWTAMVNGRTVQTFLRGRLDGAYVRSTSRRYPRNPRLFETKSRTDINEEELIDTLPMNLQTSIYLIALEDKTKLRPVEVEYNIIRKTALRQSKKEDFAAYERRIIQDVKSRMDWYFVRMHMTVESKDLARMRREISDLVNDFLNWWYGYSGHYRNDASCYRYRRPCDMLKKCAYGETVNLFKREHVFSELED